jgi:hypothetical protein
MPRFSRARRRHILLRALVTTTIAVKRQKSTMQPRSDLTDMETMIDDLCETDAELGRYIDAAFWSLGFARPRTRQRRRGPKS